MGYYLTVLAENADNVPVSRLRANLVSQGLDAIIEADEGVDEEWEQIILQHRNGQAIASIERHPIEPGSLGESIITDFLEEITDEQPRSAVEWLANYLPTIKVIYSLQLLSGTDVGPGWEAVWEVERALWSTLGGILHAEAEGFSNRDGHHILWEFNGHVQGPWEMAVLNENGHWDAFRMGLGNEAHKEAFLSGRVPDGVQRI